MCLNFCIHALPSLGTLSNTGEMGALLCSGSPGVLPSCRKGQSLSLFPTTSPHCCARLLHPSSAGLGSSACTCEWSNVTAFTFVLPARTHLPQTWYISTGSPHSLATSTHSQLLFRVSLKITNPDLQPVSAVLSACCVAVPPPHLQNTSSMGAQIMICASSQVRGRPGADVYLADGN